MPFPAEGAASPEVDELLHGPAAALTAVALVAGPQAHASGWAPRAAVALASQWHGPRRIALVDLGLTTPSLHAAAGIRNEEGVADVVGYGVSLSVVRQPAGDGSFDVVPTGLYVADAGAVLRSPTWSRVLVEIAQQRGTLLAYLPADADGAEVVVRRAGAVIVLAADDEAQGIVESLPHPYAVLAVLTPAPPALEDPVVAAAAAPIVAAAQEAVVEDEPAGSERAPAADERAAAAVERAAAAVEDEPVVEAATAAPLVEAATAEVPEPEPAGAAGAAGAGSRHDEPEPLVAAAAPEELSVPQPAVPARAAEPARLSDEEFDRIRLPTDRESRDALIADLRERQRAARLAPPAGAELPAAVDRAPERGAELGEVLVPGPAGERGRDMRVETMGDGVALDTLDPGGRDGAPRRSRARSPLGWTLAIVLILAVVAGSWRFLAGRLGFGVAVEAPVPVEDPEPAVPPPPPGAELTWAVALEAHTDLATALRRLDALAGEPGLTFHITPLEREGTLYYHIMAGPVTDSATALALRDTLLARRLKRAATPTDVRHAPLAFLVGDYATPDDATEAMTDLRRLDLPAYMLLADAADGATAYRVYVGGFATAAEADVTRQLLRAAGVRDTLVTRTGSPPQ